MRNFSLLPKGANTFCPRVNMCGMLNISTLLYVKKTRVIRCSEKTKKILYSFTFEKTGLVA